MFSARRTLPAVSTQNKSAKAAWQSRQAKDLLLSSPAELPHAAEDAAVSLDTERQTADEGAAADEEGEPSAAELRRRRLRKLASSPFTPPPPEN